MFACFVLHNIALARKQPDFDDNIEEGVLFERMMPRANVPEPSTQQEARNRRLGFEKRRRIATNIFRRRRHIEMYSISQVHGVVKESNMFFEVHYYFVKFTRDFFHSHCSLVTQTSSTFHQHVQIHKSLPFQSFTGYLVS